VTNIESDFYHFAELTKNKHVFALKCGIRIYFCSIE